MSYYKVWVKQGFNNYSARYYLIKAELAKLKNRHLEAQKYYEDSIESAEINDFKHIKAIACECLARFFLLHSKEKLARFYILESYNTFQKSNYIVMIRSLEQEFAMWLKPIYQDIVPNIFDKKTITSNTTYASVNSIDFLSVLKSIQVLASEINLEQLLEKMLTILQENAGAQRSILLKKKSEKWYVEADGTMGEHSIYLDSQPKVDEFLGFPLNLFYYVLRTRQPLIISDAQVTELALADNYIRQNKVHSVLILPIFHHNKMDYIIYLENNSMSGMFNDKHVQILQILASQLVISLDNAKLYHQATRDPLTQLANRNFLYQTFQQRVRVAKRHKKLIAILFFDLDFFKKINDTLGHEIGDQLLVHIADTLKNVLREYELPARLGGDEFVIMLEELDDSSQAKAIIERIYSAFAQPVPIQGHVIPISLSMGVSFYPLDGEDIQTLIKKADTALYYCKSQGRGRYYIYHPQISHHMTKSNIHKRDLQQAIAQEQFCLYYQPIFDSEQQHITGLEVLLRWEHPTRGMLAAKNFVDLLEETGLIVSVTEWIIEKACEQLAKWKLAGLNNVPIAINVSGLQFKKQNLTAIINEKIKMTGLDTSDIILEITESMLIDNFELVLTELKNLADCGVEISIDDFGTGYATLLYLKHFPAKKLKLAKVFVENTQQQESEDQIIIKMITSLAHQLKLKVIAEGVETPEQYDFLKSCAVDEIQGHLFSAPLSRSDCTELFLKKGLIK